MRLAYAFPSAVLLPTALAGALLVAGCSSPSGASADATADYSAILPNSDDGGGDDAEDAADGAATTPMTTLRLAHVSPDLPPVDFCWRSAGSATFTGPVLSRGWTPPQPDAGSLADSPGETGAGDDATVRPPHDAGLPDARDASEETGAADSAAEGGEQDAAPGDAAAGAPSVSYGEVTSSLQLDTTGTFDIAILDAGATTCESPILVRPVTLDAGKHATVALVGLLGALGKDGGGGQSLSLAAFTDNGALDPKNARVRLIHAALGWPGPASAGGPAPSLRTDVGTLEIAAEVDPRRASAMSGSPPVDALGYATVPPSAPSTVMTFRGLGDAGSQAWVTSPADLDLLGGTLHTGFVVSRPLGSLGLLWCSDGATSASNLPTACQLFEAPQAAPY